MLSGLQYWQSVGYPGEHHIYFEHLMERYAKSIVRHDVWNWVQKYLYIPSLNRKIPSPSLT